MVLLVAIALCLKIILDIFYVDLRFQPNYTCYTEVLKAVMMDRVSDRRATYFLGNTKRC